MKPWYWEMERAGWGPHQYLSLEFAPENSALLRQLLFDSPPQGFSPEARTEGQTYSWGDWPLADDTLIWGREGNYQWGFAFALLTGSMLVVEHGWQSPGEEDSIWLRQVLGESPLSLQHWQVSAGGDGYNPNFCRNGRDASSLLAYMRGEVLAPDWEHIKRELSRALRQHDPQGKFTLSECLLDDEAETLTATLLYDVPRAVDGAWLPDPGWQELIIIAREVGEVCDVPYSASGASVHAPDNWQRYMGGSITFGIRSRR